MLDNLCRIWEEGRVIEKGDRIIVGISGGADSVCLLRLLCSFREKWGLYLFGVHIHHGVRGKEADRDAAFAEKLCETMKVSFRLVRSNIPDIARAERISEEEAGRQVRYEAFRKAAEENFCHKIAVAHNRNDNAETVLWNLLRGSGLRGISGIRSSQDFGVGCKLVRPLLTVSRTEIEAYLRELGQEYCEDSTNGTDQYTRNRIRNRVIPMLQKEINAGAGEHIIQAAAMVSEAEEYLKRKADSWLEREQISIFSGETDLCRLPVEPFLAEAGVIRKIIVRDVLEQAAGRSKDFTAAHMEAFCTLFERPVGKKISLPYRLTAVKEYGAVLLCRSEGQEKQRDRREYHPEIPGEVRIGQTGRTVVFSVWEPEKEFRVAEGMLVFSDEEKIKIPGNGCTKWFDYDKIYNTVCIRTRKDGDRIKTDTDGHSKKLKAYFIDEKIPREQRDDIWLLAAGNEVLWILGGRSFQSCYVSEETKRILIAEIKGGY